MMGRIHVPLRVAAVSASVAVVAMMAAAPAVAAEGDVDIVNTETVQIYTDATGSVETKRIYEQISLTGDGTVEFRNPIETAGLRNLDGFGGFDVENGEQVAKMTVDGKERLRTVSDYDGDLPLDIQVQYYLDGEMVDPSDVVGKSGLLEVKYKVKNVTAAPQEVTYDDGTGNMVTDTVDVPIPMVGSLTVVAPPNFTDVKSGEANMAGDGKGGTKLSFTMTLFPPIGSDTAEFGYEAQISDGVIPRASVTALPVNPLESPSFKAAGESYKGGADTGIELTDGASQIDANLLKLRDGAGELLAGLIQLRDGAQELNAGLAGEAAPGANKLAAGASELSGGLGQLDDGAGKLAAGAGELNDGAAQLNYGANRLDAGAGQLAGGTKRLQSGAGQLSAGLKELGTGVGDLDGGATQLADGQKALVSGLKKLRAGVEVLPDSVKANLASNGDYQKFLGALSSLAGGAGTLQDGPAEKTLLGGLQKLRYGLDNPLATPAACEAGDVTKCGATDALDHIITKLDGALAGPADSPGTVAALKAAILDIKNAPAGYPGVWCDAGCQQKVDATAAGVAAAQTASLTDLKNGLLRVSGGVKQNITGPGAGIDQLRAGLSTGVDPSTCAVDPSACGIREAALFLQLYGTPALVQGITEGIRDELLVGIGTVSPGCDPEGSLLCAAAALADGGTKLDDGINKLVAGVVQLNDGGALLASGAGELAAGAGRLSAGTGELSDGTGRLAEGTGELSAGAGQLADGTGKAADGSNQLADGANQLATGLGDAASGSGRLADGLKTAAKGAPKLENGAQRLSDEGTSKLVEAGESTAQNYGQMYASLEAGAERAQTEKMVYGAPADAMGLAAYSYEIKGEDGEGGRNLGRGLGGAALLAAGAGAFALRRRFI